MIQSIQVPPSSDGENPSRRLVLGLLKLMFASTAIFGAILLAWEHLAVDIDKYIDRIGWLRVEDLQIHAAWPLSPESVRKYLPPIEGRSILSTHPRALIDLLESKPWVEAVTVKKEYPNRISVDVTAKRAVAVLLTHGTPYFVDDHGAAIERATPAMLKTIDLPLASFVKETEAAEWPTNTLDQIVDSFHQVMDPRYTISQIVLERFPYFRLFLSPTKIEVAFSWENWELQLPILTLLLHRPADLTDSHPGQPQRINLVFPKKAIVSHSLSN